jgi:hypothetical protein
MISLFLLSSFLFFLMLLPMLTFVLGFDELFHLYPRAFALCSAFSALLLCWRLMRLFK